MTAEEHKELVKKEVQATLKAIEEEKAKAVEELDPVSPEQGEMAERIKVLETEKVEWEKTQEALKAPVDPKLDPEKDPDEPPDHGFKHTTHFFHDIVKAGPAGRDESDELIAWRRHCDKVEEKAAGSPTQSVGVAEAGGYVVPTEYVATAWVRQTERSAFMQNAVQISMNSKTLKMPAMMGYDESSQTYYGNVAWKWIDELVELTATDIELEQIELSLEKLTGMVYISEELQKWGNPAIMPLIDIAFDVGLNRALSGAFLRGTGAGKPLGILNTDAKIEIAAETNQASGTFLLDNMLNMQARLYAVDEDPTGIWFANRTLLPQLAKLVLPGGTASTPMFMTSALPKPTYTLMGLPMKFSTLNSAAGVVGDIVLTDPSQYFIGRPASGEAVEQASSIHVAFIYGQSAFKFTTWIAGQPAWRTTFTPEYGDSMAPNMTLAAR